MAQCITAFIVTCCAENTLVCEDAMRFCDNYPKSFSSSSLELVGLLARLPNTRCRKLYAIPHEETFDPEAMLLQGLASEQKDKLFF
jgi:hypothetical protein